MPNRRNASYGVKKDAQVYKNLIIIIKKKKKKKKMKENEKKKVTSINLLKMCFDNDFSKM